MRDVPPWLRDAVTSLDSHSHTQVSALPCSSLGIHITMWKMVAFENLTFQPQPQCQSITCSCLLKHCNEPRTGPTVIGPWIASQNLTPRLIIAWQVTWRFISSTFTDVLANSLDTPTAFAILDLFHIMHSHTHIAAHTNSLSLSLSLSLHCAYTPLSLSPSLSLSLTHTHTHIHARARTHTHTHTHTLARTHALHTPAYNTKQCQNSFFVRTVVGLDWNHLRTSSKQALPVHLHQRWAGQHRLLPN